MSEPSEPVPTTVTTGLAVELYLDAAAEASIRDFRALIYQEGVKPVQGSMNDKPHISLAVLPAINPAPVIELAARFAAQISPFAIRLGAVGTFPTQENVLFLYPAPSTSLLSAHAALHRMLREVKITSSSYYFPGNWIPHLTLEFNLENGELNRSVEVFKKHFNPIDGEVTQLGVVGFRPIQYLRHFDLKKSQ